MKQWKIFPPFRDRALDIAIHILENEGLTILSSPDPEATHLLLPAPSPDPGQLLEQMPNAVLIGGNLNISDRPVIDLLRDEFYVAENAMITAHCALKLAMARLDRILPQCRCLVIGWGRIAKCLSRLLHSLGCPVTVAARKEADRAITAALGLDVTDIAHICPQEYDIIFNTAPAMVLPECAGNALKIDLASQLGIGGSDVLWARGLPRKEMPESAGKLIARTVLRLLEKEGS